MLPDPTTLLPTLWIGTTLGSVLTMMISLPDTELRHTQPVVVSTSGECQRAALLTRSTKDQILPMHDICVGWFSVSLEF